MKQIPFSLIAAILVTSCVTRGPSRIDNAMLSEVSTEEMTPVSEARNEAIQAEDAYAKAQRDTKWAEEQVELAESALKVSRSQVDDSKLAVGLTKKSGTVGELHTAEASYDYHLANADAQREFLALRKRELEVTRLAEKLAREVVAHKRAVVELRKAEAVQTLDRIEARNVPLKDYERQVRYQETEVELARVRLDAAKTELKETQGEYDAVRTKATSLQPAKK